jgi:hypothetical protein
LLVAARQLPISRAGRINAAIALVLRQRRCLLRGNKYFTG